MVKSPIERREEEIKISLFERSEERKTMGLVSGDDDDAISRRTSHEYDWYLLPWKKKGGGRVTGHL
jgi:hypothetical protein